MTVAPDPICVACQGTDSSVFWEDPSRTIRRCRSCGLLFVFPQPDVHTIHNEFQSNYFTNGHSPALTRLELEFEAWRKPTLARIVRQIRALKPAGKLLDVGCASGELFDHFPNGNWELYGIEPSSMAFERARKRFEAASQIHLINAYLHDVSLKPKSLDVITILESLYYMPNPRQELSYVARILRNDGLLAIAMPGYTYQRLRHSGPISHALYGSPCSLTKSHLFYFSRKSLAALLKSEGFEIFETIQLGSSSYGSSVGQFARQTYLNFSKILGSLTLGKVNLAPHVLYLCEKRKETLA